MVQYCECRNLVAGREVDVAACRVSICVCPVVWICAYIGYSATRACMHGMVVVGLDGCMDGRHGADVDKSD